MKFLFLIGLLPAFFSCSEKPFTVAVTFPEAAGLKH